MRTHWLILKDKAAPPRLRWRLEYKPEGGQWGRLSSYPTRKAAAHVAMIMRERGDPVSWEGPPIRLGLALIDPCAMPKD